MKTLLDQHATRLDALGLDCENLVRVIATLLSAKGASYEAHRGSLWVKGIGHVDPHHWIVLSSGETVDFRARLWLGNEAHIPHGVFTPTHAQIYTSHSTFSAVVHEVVFFALTGVRICNFGAGEKSPSESPMISSENSDITRRQTGTTISRSAGAMPT
ncbi:hypothetical protein D5S10_29565 (plasmid) [Pseudomonas savastanoi]|nr:hypothetical protein D5S10_29565 [Pseudomonas savastanoi]